MIRFDKKNGIVFMTLVDLEHCGFDRGEYCSELRMAGIPDHEARSPIALVVNFAGGAIVTPRTSPESLKRMRCATERFETLVRKLSGDRNADDLQTGLA